MQPQLQQLYVLWEPPIRGVIIKRLVKHQFLADGSMTRKCLTKPYKFTFS